MTPICHGTFSSNDAFSRGCACCMSFNSCVKKTIDYQVAQARENRKGKK